MGTKLIVWICGPTVSQCVCRISILGYRAYASQNKNLSQNCLFHCERLGKFHDLQCSVIVLFPHSIPCKTRLEQYSAFVTLAWHSTVKFHK